MNLNKILGALLFVCVVVIVILFLANRSKEISLRKTIDENSVLKEALNKPKVNETTTTKKWKVTVPEKPSKVIDISEDDVVSVVQPSRINNATRVEVNSPATAPEIKQAERVLEYSETTTTRQSEPIIPVQQSNVNDKKLTGLVEYKIGDYLNLGIACKVYKETSIGGSINTNGKIGIMTLVRF